MSNPNGTNTIANPCEGCDGPLDAEGEDAIFTDDDTGKKFCCEGCYDDWRERDYEGRCESMESQAFGQEDDYYLIDGVGFADPGGNSALRAATRDNPRNLPCPSCKAPNRLTPADRRAGYQCDRCSDRAEGRGDY